MKPNKTSAFENVSKQFITWTVTPIFIGFFLLGCSNDSQSQYTFYRTGIDFRSATHDETLRIYVASFTAINIGSDDENRKYNSANCEFAQELFSSRQPHYEGSIFSKIKIKYWCEKGDFKK